MKALSLWQPWASLIAVGAKKYETRGWKTNYRGPLVICAAKRAVDQSLFLQGTTFGAVCRALPHPPRGYSFNNALPRGVALCIAELVACIPTEELEDGDAHLRGGKEYLLASDELHFGDFSEGRFAWRLGNVRAFPSPFPVKGKQGLFDLFPNEETAVREQIQIIKRNVLAKEVTTP